MNSLPRDANYSQCQDPIASSYGVYFWFQSKSMVRLHGGRGFDAEGYEAEPS